MNCTECGISREAHPFAMVQHPFTPPWPTHPDGRRKRMGEMTKEENREQATVALYKLKVEMQSPAFKRVLQEAARG